MSHLRLRYSQTQDKIIPIPKRHVEVCCCGEDNVMVGTVANYSERCSKGGLYYPMVYNSNFPRRRRTEQYNGGSEVEYRVQHGLRDVKLSPPPTHMSIIGIHRNTCASPHGTK